MLHERVVTRIPNDFKDSSKGVLNLLERHTFIQMEEDGADIALVKSVIT